MISKNQPEILVEKELTLPEKKELASNQRINNYIERRARESPEINYKAKMEDGNVTSIEANFHDTNLSADEKGFIHNALLCHATGSVSQSFGKLILEQTMSSFFRNKQHDVTLIANATHDALVAMNPADEYEGMLCSRLLALHNQYMNFMTRSCQPNQTTEGIDLNINRATKLMRLYNETLDCLNRHRRKGEQKITVQHVNVNSGGQAVIGDVNTGIKKK